MAKPNKPAKSSSNTVTEANFVGQTAGSRRRSKALQIVYGDRPVVRMDPKGIVWEVPSQTDSSKYTVNLKRVTCECRYWRDKRRVCKHIEAARFTEAGTRVDQGEGVDLPPTSNPYKNAPYYDALKEAETSILLQLVRCLGLELTKSKESK